MPSTGSLRAVILGLLLLLFLSVAPARVGSASADTSAEPPPANASPPRLTGLALVGQILQASRGTWRGDRNAVFSYQWRICDAAGATCADVDGANDVIYPVRPTDLGHRLLVVVTVATKTGESAVSSAPTPVVRDARPRSPVVAVRPSIGGKAVVGAVLTVSPGEWKGAEPVRFQYRWRRCAADGGACVSVARRTASTYVLGARDVGRTIRVLVQARNASGVGAALSDATSEIQGPTNVASAPRSTAPPVISGVASQGRALTVSSGTWSGTTPMQFRFQWLRCDKNGNGCSRIGRATQQAYTLVAADVGHALRARVAASNVAGSSSATSDRTQVVTGVNAPVSTSLPAISGTAREGAVLTVSAGAWRGDPPIRFSYRWLRCDRAGAACAEIPGANRARRVVTSADVGHALRARVTAENRGGASSVVSSPSAVIVSRGTAPANRVAPVLSGTPQQGERLTLTNGTWVGTQPITYSYAWQRCGASLGDCKTIGGATGNTYVLGRADVGHRLYGVVTARNGAGETGVPSNATAVVVGAPFNTALPSISGNPVEGQVLTAVSGSWQGVQPISFGYQWTRCDASGVFSTCAPIIVTSRSSYTLRAADVGHRILVQVKAVNRFGASYVNSAQTQVVGAAPIGTVTIASGRAVVRYGNAVTMSGRAAGAPAGEPVTIVEQPTGGRARTHVRAALTTTAGTWTWVARPSVRTTYRAVIRGRTSAARTVWVEPRVRLAKARGARDVTVHVYAARRFVGRVATLQRWNPAQRRWVAVQRVRLRSARAGTAPTVVTSVTFRTRAPRGALVRVVLPSRQTGAGYLAGVSNRIRA